MNTRLNNFLNDKLFPEVDSYLKKENTLIGFFILIDRYSDVYDDKIDQDELNLIFQKYLLNKNINIKKYKIYCLNNYTDYEFRISYGSNY